MRHLPDIRWRGLCHGPGNRRLRTSDGADPMRLTASRASVTRARRALATLRVQKGYRRSRDIYIHSNYWNTALLIVLFVFSFSYKTRRAAMEHLLTTSASVKGPRRVRLGSSSAETSYNSESMSWKIPEKVTLGSSFHKYFSFCAKSRHNHSWRKQCCIAKKCSSMFPSYIGSNSMMLK